MKPVDIAPSILAADFSRLGEQVREALDAGVKYIHVDVMDGHFVPNISIGPLVVRALRPLATAYHALLDVHLMISQPDAFLSEFAEAGADVLTVHVEACRHLHRTVQKIRESGVRPGITLNPATGLETLSEILPYVDQVLIMSVNPGFGGQSYIPASTDKIKRLRRMLDERQSHARLEVDGGIVVDNIAQVVAAGADILVAGSAVFRGAGSIGESIAGLQRAIQRDNP